VRSRRNRIGDSSALVALVERFGRCKREVHLVEAGGKESVVSLLVQYQPRVHHAWLTLDRSNDLLGRPGGTAGTGASRPGLFGHVPAGAKPPARPPELRAITVRRAQDPNTFVIAVNARDPDNGALRYLYMVTEGSVRPAGASATWTVPGPGQYTVAVTVFGQNGCTISSTALQTPVVEHRERKVTKVAPLCVPAERQRPQWVGCGRSTMERGHLTVRPAIFSGSGQKCRATIGCVGTQTPRGAACDQPGFEDVICRRVRFRHGRVRRGQRPGEWQRSRWHNGRQRFGAAGRAGHRAGRAADRGLCRREHTPPAI